MCHIFLSYSHEDKDTMTFLKNFLTGQGLPVWTDENLEPGTPEWTETIEKAISGSLCLIVILSPSAKKSVWVRRELNYAESQDVKIFPVLAKGSLKDATPIYTTGIQTIDISSRKTRATELKRLVSAIENHQKSKIPQQASPVIEPEAKPSRFYSLLSFFITLVLLEIVIVLGIPFGIENFWRDKPTTPLEILISKADKDLCPGSTDAEYVNAAWEGDLKTVTACVKRLLRWKKTAEEQQAIRVNLKTCDTMPSTLDTGMEAHFNAYWALDSLGTGYLILGQRLQEAGETELAQEAFQTVLNRYSCAWNYDPTEDIFWSVGEAALSGINQLE